MGMVAAVQGLIGGVTFWAMGLPAPAAWGVAVGICSLIPVVGATLVWVPVAIWWLLTGAIMKAIVLAAKILAVNPKLSPPDVIRVIRDTADKTPDGRRTLVNPKKALAKVEGKSA